MILSLFRKNNTDEQVFAIYGSIVAQSRQPQFYAQWAVPDTVTGRFDMISLHMALVFRRLRGDNKIQRDFSQALFDLFFKDMDRSLREMGVGDIGVPKKIQKMGNLFFGLLANINGALDTGDLAALDAVIVRNLYDTVEKPEARELSRYLSEQDAILQAQEPKTIMAGTIEFGDAK